jgi:putative lipoprotein (rSAM/lipoprotein system)
MVHISKIFRIIISALVALLGFSCGYGEDNWGTNTYGSPHATYKVKGIVVSNVDDSPIKGIRAELTGNATFTIATSYTDNSGFFFLEGSEFPRLKLLLVLTDAEESTFARKEVEADFSTKTFTGGSGWFAGTAEIDLGTIRMIPE